MSSRTKANGVATISSGFELVERCRKDYEKKSVQELKEELLRLMSLKAESLVRLAVIVQLLDRHQYDFSKLKIGLIPYLRKIAAQELLPDVVVKYSGDPRDLARIVNLSVDQQRKVLSGKAQLESFVKKRKLTVGKSKQLSGDPEQEVRNPLITPIMKEEREAYDPQVVAVAYMKSAAAANVCSSGTAPDVAELLFELINKHYDRGLVVMHLARRLRAEGFSF